MELSDAQITSISGSVSGFAATFAKQPIQRIKWIRQVDAGPSVPYMELVYRTVRADGMLGLFRGSVAGIMRNVPHSALVYTIYPKFEAIVLQQQQQLQLQQQPPPAPERQPTTEGAASSSIKPARQKVQFSTRFWAGYATTFFATLVTHPLDTLRVRISVMHGEMSTPSMIRSVLESGGLRTLYQGFGATLIGAGPRGAVGFGVFETLKEVSEKRNLLADFPTTRKLLIGYFAGLCSETAIYPLDTVRRRQQALGDASPVGRTSNVFSALALVVRSEGFMGLFKGLSLNLIKNPIATAVSFTVNDVVKDQLKRQARRKEGM
jgi:solute carrier family 25 protein 42